MSSQLLRSILIPASIGVLAHVGYFNRGEHTGTAHRIFYAAFTAPLCAVAFLNQVLGVPLATACSATAFNYGIFLFGLFASMIVYRLAFHPLRRYPGPRLARITQLYHFLSVNKKADNFRHLDRLHSRYGKYVRTAPNILSVAEPDWVEPVHARQSHFVKSDLYAIRTPRVSLQQMRDPVLHDKRRRSGWEKAFTNNALRAYDSRVLKYADLLVQQMRKRSGQVVNATKWFEFFAFDVMGDLAFGKAFNVVETGKSHFYLDTLYTTIVRFTGMMPWVGRIIWKLPKFIPDPLRHASMYGKACIDERKSRKLDQPDTISYLLEAQPFFDDPKQDEELLTADATLLIIAGSDTTSTTLIHAFYHLARDPTLLGKLRQELQEYKIVNDTSYNIQALQPLPYLNGFINETLRLHPPVPGAFPRTTPPEGILIDGQQLPGGITILTPTYTIQRSPKAFVKPNEFIPERWTSRPELVLDKHAFFPFSLGRYSCIGKQLALNELRVVISKLVLEFDVEFADGEDGRTLLEESKDIFTTVNAKLDLRFQARGT